LWSRGFLRNERGTTCERRPHADMLLRRQAKVNKHPYGRTTEIPPRRCAVVRRMRVFRKKAPDTRIRHLASL